MCTIVTKDSTAVQTAITLSTSSDHEVIATYMHLHMHVNIMVTLI